MADKIDTLMSERLDYAADSKLGYLTACPTNLGTAMRASVMVHLPAIETCGLMSNVNETISKIGMTIRGMYGEGSGSLGSIYQISNQVTLGITEADTLSKLNRIISKIIGIERDARKTLMQKYPEIKENIWRAAGTMMTARKLTSREFIELFSAVREGVEIGILTEHDETSILCNANLTYDMLDELFIEVQPGTLMMSVGREMTPEERDIKRAEKSRAMFIRALSQ